MEHFRQEKNEYFTHAVMLVTSDDSLGPTEISYLENAFHSRALAAGRVRTLNSNDPSPGTVTEEKKADLEEFIAFATIAIGSLGYRIFEKADDDKASVTAHPVPAPDAKFLMGSSANGKLQWKSESGIPLGQLEQQELAE
ncbi:hypothetical protein CYJ40_07020 [Brevibacterium ravenspurgense]|uniref:DUF4357 domain-containing protein n=1 Tax=Brevibacterium ravenspurgense TaxID=479117 RepID=A0A2I1IG72_9MICO|nr:hypothetical protein [Brevibacterium ravenspurgense]PKY70128.1 hypothetical protein CYJ40_07020 [Brevibacterium ravenspurgense]